MSLALRRSKGFEDKHVEEPEELIKEVRAQLIGPVRQELLNGIKSEKQYRIAQNQDIVGSYVVSFMGIKSI